MSRDDARPTMVDVAKRAGVSQATVSLVLNEVGGSRVTEKTKRLVHKAAGELGYRMWRRSPVGSGAIQTIGYLIEDTITHPLVNIAIEAARKTAWENDCVLMVLPTQEDPRLRTAALEVLMGNRLAGLIFSSFFTSQITIPSLVRSQSLVLLNCYADGDAGPSLLPDHSGGAEAATARLIELGHRRIAFINGDRWMDAYRDRLRGYRKALKTAGIAFEQALVRNGDGLLSGGQKATAELMSLQSPPTAIFCGSDRMAIGCYEELKQRGLHIPRDISVIGFDDDPVVRYLDPPLTTVLVPHEEMGRRSVEHLLAKRSGRTDEQLSRKSFVSCSLIERGSTVRLCG